MYPTYHPFNRPHQFAVSHCSQPGPYHHFHYAVRAQQHAHLRPDIPVVWTRTNTGESIGRARRPRSSSRKSGGVTKKRRDRHQRTQHRSMSAIASIPQYPWFDDPFNSFPYRTVIEPNDPFDSQIEDQWEVTPTFDMPPNATNHIYQLEDVQMVEDDTPSNTRAQDTHMNRSSDWKYQFDEACTAPNISDEAIAKDSEGETQVSENDLDMIRAIEELMRDDITAEEEHPCFSDVTESDPEMMRIIQQLMEEEI